MENKQKLEDKAVDIKGKKYVLVSDRVVYFNELYKNGSITTELISNPNDEMVLIKAIVTPDCDKPNRLFTGYSQAKWGAGFINKTSAIENCETSAVGRALAMLGIGIIDSIASVDEINKSANPAYNQPREPVTGMYELKLVAAVENLEKESSNMSLDDLQLRLDHASGLCADYPELLARVKKLYLLLPTE